MESGYCLATKGFGSARPKSPVVAIDCNLMDNTVSITINSYSALSV